MLDLYGLTRAWIQNQMDNLAACPIKANHQYHLPQFDPERVLLGKIGIEAPTQVMITNMLQICSRINIIYILTHLRIIRLGSHLSVCALMHFYALLMCFCMSSGLLWWVLTANQPGMAWRRSTHALNANLPPSQTWKQRYPLSTHRFPYRYRAPSAGHHLRQPPAGYIRGAHTAGPSLGIRSGTVISYKRCFYFPLWVPVFTFIKLHPYYCT